MAARKSVFTVDGDLLNITSPCVQEAAKGTPYKFAQNTYHVTYVFNSICCIKNCLRQAIYLYYKNMKYFSLKLLFWTYFAYILVHINHIIIL
jgi:hypothetical protein